MEALPGSIVGLAASGRGVAVLRDSRVSATLVATVLISRTGLVVWRAGRLQPLRSIAAVAIEIKKKGLFFIIIIGWIKKLINVKIIHR